MLDDNYDPDIDNDEIVELNMKASIYQYGLDGEIQDIDEAIKYFLKAYNLGSNEAKEELKMIYSDLVDIYDNEGNYKKAIKYASDGLKIGLTEMYDSLGRIYDNREYPIYDKDKTIYYYKEGMKNNIVSSCFSLAIIYQEDKNEENAYKCYCKFFKLRDEKTELHEFYGAYYLRFVAIFQRDKIEFIEHLKPNIDNIINYLSTRLQIINYEKQQVIHPEFIRYTKAVINGEINQNNHELIGE